MNKPAVTQAQTKRALAVARAEGLTVTGFRLCPDGSTVLLFGDHLTAEPAPVADDDGGWEAHAKRHGYG